MIPLRAAAALAAAALPAQAPTDPPPRLSPVRQLFFKSLGEPYLLDGTEVPSARDRSVLASYLRDDNPHLRKAATISYHLERLVAAVREGRALEDEPGSGCGEFQSFVTARLLHELAGDRGAFRDVATMSTGERGAIAFELESFSKGLTARVCAAAALAVLRDAVANAQRALPVPPATLGSDDLHVAFGPVLDGSGLLLENHGQTLRDCTIVCSYQPDVAAVVGAMARSDAGVLVPWFEQPLLRQNDDATKLHAQHALWAIEALECGFVVHVTEWPRGTALQVPLSSNGSLRFAPGRGTLSLWSDGAQCPSRTFTAADYSRQLAKAEKASQPGAADDDAEIDAYLKSPLPKPTPTNPAAPTAGDGPAAVPSDGGAPAAPAAVPRPVPVEFDDSVPHAAELDDATHALDDGKYADARKALQAVTDALARSPVEGQPAARLAAVVRYRLAESNYQLGLQTAKLPHKSDDAERLFVAADRALTDAFADDFATAREGSSLRAMALRLRVLCNAVLFLGYKDLAEQAPTSKVYKQKRERFRVASNSLFKELEKSCADATMADGRRVVDVVRAECVRAMR